MRTLKFLPAVLGVLALSAAFAANTPGRADSSPATGAPARLPAAGDNLKPFLALRPAGGVYLAWAHRTGEKAVIQFARSQDGTRISSPTTLSPANMHLDLGAENGPNVAVDSRGSIYVVWTAGSTSAPAAPAPNAPKPAAGGMKAHAGSHPPRPGNLNIWLARSDDDGATFSPPVQVNDGAEGPEHRFPTVGVDSKGGVCVAWLDKRNKTSEGEDMARVYFARSADGGKTFRKNVDATAGQPYPICHCCRVAMTTDPEQGVMIAFRNDIHDLRDIFLVHSGDEGGSFSTPMPLEQTKWKFPACPMDGPSVGIDPSGTLHAAWMSMADIRRKPLWGKVGASDSKVLYNRAAPGSTTVGEPVVLGEGHHPRLAVGQNGEAFILWHRDSSILLTRMGPGAGDAVRPIQLADEKGTASYPSLALGADGTVYCAWQQTMPDNSVQLFLRRVPASRFEQGR